MPLSLSTRDKGGIWRNELATAAWRKKNPLIHRCRQRSPAANLWRGQLNNALLAATSLLPFRRGRTKRRPRATESVFPGQYNKRKLVLDTAPGHRHQFLLLFFLARGDSKDEVTVY